MPRCRTDSRIAIPSAPDWEKISVAKTVTAWLADDSGVTSGSDATSSTSSPGSGVRQLRVDRSGERGATPSVSFGAMKSFGSPMKVTIAVAAISPTTVRIRWMMS